MKKNKILVISGSILLLGCYFGWLTTRYAGVEPVISPTAPRPWVTPIAAFATPTKIHLPVLGPKEVPIFFKQENKTATSIRFKNTQKSSNNLSLNDYGKRFHANKNNIVELPNGERIKFIGFATTRPDDIITKSANGKIAYQWYDPTTLLPIENAKQLGLRIDGYATGDKTHQFFTAFKRVGKIQSLRWHSATLRNAQILTRLSSGCSWQTTDDSGVQIYEHQRQFYHNTPIDITFAISYGVKEYIDIDVHNAPLKNAIYTPSREAAITPLYRGSGSHRSASYSTDFYSYTWKNDKRDKPFIIYQTSPPGIVSQMQIIRPDKSQTHSHQAVSRLTLSDDTSGKPYRFQVLSDVAHCQYKLAGVPQLPKSDNLLTVPMSPLEIRYPGQFDDTLQRATGLDITFNTSNALKGLSFPMTYESVTPQELLDEFGQQTTFRIDYENFQVNQPKVVNWWQRIKDFLRL